MMRQVGRTHGTQSVKRSSEMRRKTLTMVQKMLTEEGGGTQHANRALEMRHKTCTVAQKNMSRVSWWCYRR